MKNLEKYGQEKPPRVEIEKITLIPIAMFVGTSDDLVDILDARWTRD